MDTLSTPADAMTKLNNFLWTLNTVLLTLAIREYINQRLEDDLQTVKASIGSVTQYTIRVARNHLGPMAYTVYRIVKDSVGGAHNFHSVMVEDIQPHELQFKISKMSAKCNMLEPRCDNLNKRCDMLQSRSVNLRLSISNERHRQDALTTRVEQLEAEREERERKHAKVSARCDRLFNKLNSQQLEFARVVADLDKLAFRYRELEKKLHSNSEAEIAEHEALNRVHVWRQDTLAARVERLEKKQEGQFCGEGRKRNVLGKYVHGDELYHEADDEIEGGGNDEQELPGAVIYEHDATRANTPSSDSTRE